FLSPVRGPHGGLAVQDLTHCAAALQAGVKPLSGLVAVTGMFVPLLDEEPVLAAAILFARLHAHEHELAVEAIAMQSEFEVAFGEAFVRIADRLPDAAVPDHHRTCAIFAFGNDPLEAAIFERMVLGHDRKSLLARVQTGAFGHSPAFEHALMLATKIEMGARCRVLLDDEAVAFGLSAFRPRLRRLGEVPPGFVFGEGIPARSPRHGLSRLPSDCAFGSLLGRAGGCGGALGGGLAGSRALALLHALLQSVHDVDHFGGARYLDDLRPPMLELGVDQLPHRLGILILELLRIELAGFALHQLFGEVERFLVDFDILNFLEDWLSRADLVRMAQHFEDKALAERPDRDDVAVAAQYELADSGLTGVLQRLLDDHVALVGHLAVGEKVIRRLVVAHVDV